MKTTWAISIFYFFVFFSFGGLFSLLTLYLKNEALLTGGQIGTIMSVGPIIMIISQPFWGIICDYTRKPKLVLTITVFLTGICGLAYLINTSYIWIFIVAISVAFFQSAIVPISDSLVTSFVHQHQSTSYGTLRLWGAVGFSVSVLVVGKISELFGSVYIFLIFALALTIATYFAYQIPQQKESYIGAKLSTGLKKLITVPHYILFLFVTFFVFGPIYANNFYFSLFFESLGATMAGIGIAFLLMAGSEVPFMRYADAFIHKAGIIKIILLAAIVSGLRWYLYFIEPPQWVVFATAVMQGFSIGLFIPAALQYVKMISPKSVQVTAVSFYSAAGNGLGCWFCSILGGIIMDVYNIYITYLFYGLLTTIGVICVLFLPKLEMKHRNFA
ncbi:MFS transporter [Salirhabdus salicampi]|uniref:MFS transporter n=1 Tax=Salirhabdus salicampi TaxID=476102 RepID=UPI0020C2F24D|nr:MFS transporter [Salirhabdus salicampi]MCP8616439.1 MFS transporter [Salirhabdus salicampi]